MIIKVIAQAATTTGVQPILSPAIAPSPVLATTISTTTANTSLLPVLTVTGGVPAGYVQYMAITPSPDGMPPNGSTSIVAHTPIGGAYAGVGSTSYYAQQQASQVTGIAYNGYWYIPQAAYAAINSPNQPA